MFLNVIFQVHSVAVILFLFIRKADWSFFCNAILKTDQVPFSVVTGLQLQMSICWHAVQPQMKEHCRQQRQRVWCRVVKCFSYLQKNQSAHEGHSKENSRFYSGEIIRRDRGIPLKQVRMSRRTRKK